MWAVGVNGGAGALFATLGAMGLAPTAEASPTSASFNAPSVADFHLTGRPPIRVVILGAGIAGLASAYELGKAGYHCTVIEARSRVGGRNFTVRGGTTQTDLRGHTQRATFSRGVYFNAGPARIAQWMVTLDYCRELGVSVEAFANVNADAYIYQDASGRAPVRYRTAKADMYGYVAELLAKAAHNGALDKELSADDRGRLLAFLEEWGQIGGVYDGFAYTGGSNRGFASYPTAWNDYGTPLPGPPSLEQVLSSNLGRDLTFESGYDQAMMMYQPVGGMDQIPRALVRAVGAEKVRLNAIAISVENRESTVRVVYRDGRGRERLVEADYCIAALPPHVFAKTRHNLGHAVQNALDTYIAEPVGKLGLEYSRRWWELDDRVYGGITNTDLDIQQIWYPSWDFHGPRGLILGYYNTGTQALGYSELSPEDRVARAVAQGMKIHGQRYGHNLAHSFSVAWDLMPYIEGGWSIPFYDTPEYRLLQRPAGRVYFAGDWLSPMVAWQHGAFWSARDTVRALHARVMAQ